MANNFRITGNYYISKGGHDTNDGLTPDTPKKSLPTTQTQSNIIVGAGFYLSSFLFTATNGTIRSDGYVSIDFGAGNVTTNSSGVNTYVGLVLRNANSMIGNAMVFTSCSFIDFNAVGSSSISTNPSFGVTTNCIFVNCLLVSRLRLRNSIILSSNILNSVLDRYIDSCYFDFSSTITYDVNIDPAIFKNNNVQGLIILEGVKYAIQDQFTGTPQDNGYAADVYWLNEANLTANGYTGTIAGWDAAVATCINRDPKFNNASKLDFTLQADSPHIGRASDGFSNIGGTEYAQSFYAGTSNPNILLFEVSEAIDTTTNNNDWRLKPGYNEGWIRAIIKVSNNDVQISSIPYIGNYSFDSDQAGGSSTNMNVPDSKPITNEYPDYLTVTTQAANDTTLIIAGHGAVVGDWLWVDGQYREITGVPDADTVTFATSLRAIVTVGTVVKIGTFESLASLNPNRLNMKMRSSKLADVNASNWDNPLTWDNDGLAPSGQYMAQEWNNAPMIDSLNEVGFGDDSYDANYGNPINLKVVDIMIYLRNNYRS